MKKFKILVILYIVFSTWIASLQAQFPQKMSYHELSGITANSKANRDTAFNQGNFPYIFNHTGLLSDRIEIRNPFDLLYKPISFNYAGINSYGISALTNGNEINGSFNAKWESLTGRPIIDTSNIYIYPVRSPNVPTLSDNRLYRFSANLFHMTMRTAYPHAYSPEESPPRVINLSNSLGGRMLQLSYWGLGDC